jgi:cytochrome c556
MMMFRIRTIATTIVTCISVALSQWALADTEVLPSTALMKEQSQAMYRVLDKMVKGELPYDQGKANAAVDKLVMTSAKIPQAFPESIKGKTSTNSRYSTSPKAWSNRADFEEYAKNLSKAIAENRSKITSLEGLKGAYKEISDACNGCHDDYRLRIR